MHGMKRIVACSILGMCLAACGGDPPPLVKGTVLFPNACEADPETTDKACDPCGVNAGGRFTVPLPGACEESDCREVAAELSATTEGKCAGTCRTNACEVNCDPVCESSACYPCGGINGRVYYRMDNCQSRVSDCHDKASAMSLTTKRRCSGTCSTANKCAVKC